MSKRNILAGLCLAGAFVLLLFQLISSQIPGEEESWNNLAIVDFVEPEHLEWIDNISLWSIDQILNQFVAAPLYIILGCLGVFFFILERIRGHPIILLSSIKRTFLIN